MGKIRFLSESLINKIAAGEVIERPASVVKELLENSLDAQATSITVTVRHGGRELIRIADNGEGMDREDAERALQRHATSKIGSLEDICRIRSFGFRGEALPSIAAVSLLSLLTRRRDTATGTEIKVRGGNIESIHEAGIATGTTVEVADLFFNTPARRKFLRTERAEFGAIVDIVQTLTLGNPPVAFRLIRDEKIIGEYPSCMSLRERVAQIHEEEIVKALIPLQVKSGEVQIAGFVTDPGVSRINRTGQYFFINNRPVKSPALAFAVQQGYGEMLPHNRFPLAFLFFDISSARVDVNVHPAKREVRIDQERDVQKLLIDAIRETLHTQTKFPRVRLAGPYENSREAPSSFTRGKETDSTLYPQCSGSLALDMVNDSLAAVYAADGSTDPNPDGAMGVPNVPASGQGLRANDLRRGTSPRIIGQFQATYIIADYEGTLLIIDQHAAHERIVYEKILDVLMNRHAPSQRRLIPITFCLDYREQEILQEYLPMLEQIGFGINDLGRNTYSIDAVPSFLDTADPKRFILDYLHDALAGHIPRAVEEKQKALAAGIACKSQTVKGSSYLAAEKMAYLVTRLFQTTQPFVCPHGRPTCITITKEDLGRQFGRK
ncbi:MAG: DNA mismatch repair endonuclease MutL [Deltaproteobacteria bacterium]|nr:DNA mismatch repair endonuclease MutL [Deltaproteobacteria bacterium]